LNAPPDPPAATGGGCLLLRGREEKGMGKGKEGDGKGKGGRGGEGGKGRTPVPDCERAKVATLKCGGPPTMPEENRGPWSKKFENRCHKGLQRNILWATLQETAPIEISGALYSNVHQDSSKLPHSLQCLFCACLVLTTH